jgi:hypothetical protein
MQLPRFNANVFRSFGAMLVMAAVLSFGCGSDDSNDSATNAAEPRATERTGAATTPAATAGSVELSAGTHTSDQFVVPTSFTVGEGWILGIDNLDILAIEYLSPRDDDAPAGYIAFLRPERTYNPTEMNLVLGPAPEDFAAWFGAHRLLDVVSSEPTTLAGLAGTRVEIDVDQGDSFDLFELSDGAYGVYYRDHIAVYVLDAAGKQLLVSYGADSVGGFPAFEEFAQQVLETVSFKP